MNKIMLIIFSIILMSCDTKPEIITKQNPKGYIVSSNQNTSNQIVENSNQLIENSNLVNDSATVWMFLIWIFLFILLVITVINFIRSLIKA